MKTKIFEWINSGEYLSDLDEMLTEILKESINSNSESTTASIFEQELYFLIRSKTGIKPLFIKEQQVDNIKHKFGILSNRTSGKGRIDSVVNNLIIEYKHYSKLKTQEQKEAAINQVCDYLNALYNNESTKYSAILTDGLQISYFQFIGDEIRHSSLAQIQCEDIDKIIRAILFNNKKKFVPKNILKDFAIKSEYESISKSLSKIFYKNLINNPTDKTIMLYEEWQRLMHLSIEDNGKSNDIEKRRKELSLIFEDDICSPDKEYKALYALQTTYAIIVKLIACKAVDKLEYNDYTNNYYDLTNLTSLELQTFFEKMEDGYSYRNNNINNFLEGDFFSWYADKQQWNLSQYKIILKIIKCIDQYTAFNFNFIYDPIDIFKDLYMSIIPRIIRHSMGEYYTPAWLAEHVVKNSLNMLDKKEWKAIDPCCGSGIFIIALIKEIVGNANINLLSSSEKNLIKSQILSRVYGIDINPLSVLSARVGYYLALLPFSPLNNIEIPVYLGDSAIIPTKEIIDNISCYKYSITNQKYPFDVVLPERFVKMEDFSNIMSQMQSCVKTNDSNILFTILKSKLSAKELESKNIIKALMNLAKNLTLLHKNHWDGIWIRIITNFMLIARIESLDLIVGNPPWVKWEHLPAAYANKIKELCSIRHIFSMDGQYGGTQLNICALISNVTASNWLTDNGILAFLMPDSIMSQNSYSEFRKFYINYSENKRLYLQKIDRWLKPLRPFRCDNKAITQDFNTYYFSSKTVDYSKGIKVNVISKLKNIDDETINKTISFQAAKQYLTFEENKAAQLSDNSTAFSYLSAQYDYSKIIGKTSYLYRTGVEFTPQELYMLVGLGSTDKEKFYRFTNKKFGSAKYIISDIPKDGWILPTEYIYPIATGPNMEPFKYNYKNEFCILPYNGQSTKKPIDSKEMLSSNFELFQYLINHKDLIDSQSEKSKLLHRGNEFYSLSKIGPYTFADNIVLARDNTKFCACTISKQKTPWGDIKQTIGVKHTIIISQDINKRFITFDEANYICGVLNSDIVINYMHDSFKTNGFSLNKSNLYLPLYNSNNPFQVKIAELAKKAQQKSEDDIKLIQKEISKFYLELCENR